MKRRSFVQSIAALALEATLLPAAQAQDTAYPARPIRIIVPSAPGAMSDVVARMYADRLSQLLGQPAVVENMAGASSLLGARHVAKAEPDGHTLLVAANTIVTMPHLANNAGYVATDFVAIGELARAPSLLVVGGSSSIRSIPELVEAAKKNPGALSYASGGRGTTSHLPAEMFARSADVRFHHVPYKGVAATIPDLVSGRVQFMMGTATSSAELVKSGQLRALAITSESRSPAYPELPTFRELGYPQVTYSIFLGLLAPKGTPETVRKTLADAVEAVRNDPGVLERLTSMGQEVSDVRTPEQFEAVLRDEEDKSQAILKEVNIAAQS